MQPQSVKQVSRAALWLADDVEVRQATQTKLLATPVVQALLEVASQAIAHSLKAL